MNIQDELQKIHHQYGISEKANYEIQKLFDKQQEISYSEEEVTDLLTTQRENCYVAILGETRNDEIATIALNAPEPGGRNGSWKNNKL